MWCKIYLASLAIICLAFMYNNYRFQQGVINDLKKLTTDFAEFRAVTEEAGSESSTHDENFETVDPVLESEESDDVTSEEIDDMMTHLQCSVTDIEDPVESNDIIESSDVSLIEPDVPIDVALRQDLLTCTFEQLDAMKYEDLRKFLRKHSIIMKGTKKDLIDRIRSVSKQIHL